MVEVDIEGVRVELPSNAPIVLLRERSGQNRRLPIFIGVAEATAIQLELDDEHPPRPMTHDLFRDTLDELGASLDAVHVTALEDRTFFAELHLSIGERSIEVSARPSDALALAVRTGAPVYVSSSVLDEAGYLVEEDDSEAPDAEQVVDEFKEFIDSVSPDDFLND